jgi:hypothetical protein
MHPEPFRSVVVNLGGRVSAAAHYLDQSLSTGSLENARSAVTEARIQRSMRRALNRSLPPFRRTG